MVEGWFAVAQKIAWWARINSVLPRPHALEVVGWEMLTLLGAFALQMSLSMSSVSSFLCQQNRIRSSARPPWPTLCRVSFSQIFENVFWNAPMIQSCIAFSKNCCLALRNFPTCWSIWYLKVERFSGLDLPFDPEVKILTIYTCQTEATGSISQGLYYMYTDIVYDASFLASRPFQQITGRHWLANCAVLKPPQLLGISDIGLVCLLSSPATWQM